MLRSCAAAIVVLFAATTANKATHANQVQSTAWFVFVDDLHLDFRNTVSLRGLLKAVMGGLVGDGDVVAVRSSGPSGLFLPLTSDRAAHEAAVRKVTGNGLKPGDIVSADGAADETRYRAAIAFNAALAMMDDVDRLQDRQAAFVYVSNGYLLQGASSASPPRRAWGARGPRPDVVSASPRDQMWDVIRKASQLRIKIFTIDPRGLGGPFAPDRRVDPVMERTFLSETRDSLRELAQQTGGLALEPGPNLAETFQRIVAELNR